MSLQSDLVGAFEIHSPEEIEECIANGIDVNELIDNKTPINHLIGMYLRTDKFSTCIKVLVDAGAKFEDKPVLAILLGNVKDLNKYLEEDSSIVNSKYSIPYSFTPLEDVTLLHICAEFNKVNCAKALITNGADINAKAGVDSDDLGGHTPIFHTVNSRKNFAYPMLELLLKNGASLDINLKGIIWGKLQEWETYIPEVNPISYAMIGNLPQFERNAEDLMKNIEIMQKYKYGKTFRTSNIPNAYLVRTRKMQEEQIIKVLDW